MGLPDAGRNNKDLVPAVAHRELELSWLPKVQYSVAIKLEVLKKRARSI